MSAISHIFSYYSRLAFPKERIPFDLSLYLVANKPSFHDENLFFSRIEKAVSGGVSCVQLRDHKSSFESAVKTAQFLKQTLSGVPLFINTHHALEVALAVDAAGVYLEESYSPFEAREKLGEKAILGMSVKTLEDVAMTSQMNVIDYISVKVSRSQLTCPRNDLIWGIDGFQKVCSFSPHRIVAIGGLNVGNVEGVARHLRLGDGVAMAGGLMREEDPCATAKKIQAILQKGRGNR